MTTTERGAPQNDPRGVHLAEAARIGNRGFPVFELTADVEELARLALAVAEVAIIEDEAGIPDSHETLGERRQSHPLRPAEAVPHHYDGKRPRAQRSIQPGVTPQAT
ncbi:hypothetical protein D3C84_398860 [compost metagenome]